MNKKSLALGLVMAALAAETTDTLAATEGTPPRSLASGESSLEETWQAARAAIGEADYGAAIKLYAELLELPDHRYTKLSQEYLGLAHERGGDREAAILAYEDYLRRYPDGEDADRVAQRLAGLVTADAQPNAPLRGNDRATKSTDGWTVDQAAGLGSFYVHVQDLGNGLNETVQSDVLTDFDYMLRARNDDYDIRADIAGDSAISLIETEDNDFALSALNLSAVSRKLGLSSTIGRQREGSHGIFSRFDGAFVGYEFVDGVTINGFGGFPVEKRSDALETNRYFVGSSLEFELFDDAFDVTVYGIQQQADGLLDRQAIGSDLRFSSSQFLAFGLVDADVSYGAINVIQANTTWLPNDRATISLGADYRKLPFLTTSNALLGQEVDDLADLETLFDEDEIRDLAEDRTPELYTGSIGGTYRLTPALLLGADVTASELSETDASGGVDATPGTGLDLFYSTRLTTTNLLTERDITSFGLRFADTSFGQTISGDVSMRYALGRNFRLNPRLRADYRFAEEDRGVQYRVRPSLALDYRFVANANLLFELGGEWASEEFLFDIDLDGEDDEEELIQSGELFLLIGTRIDF